jgi:hypothetical protein
MDWKKWIARLERRSKKNGAQAWQDAKDVKLLWSSQEFLRDGCAGVLDNLTTKLAKYSGMWGLGLNDMLQMIEHFPNRKDWESGRLDVLRDKTAQAIAAKANKNKARKKIKRDVVTHAAYNELKRKYEQLLAKYKQLEKDHRAMLKQLAVNS